MLIITTVLMISTAMAQQITVYSSGSVAIGGTRQLTAYVPLVVNTVHWSVNGVIGGDTTYGTVSTTGLYTAPVTVPSDNAVSVQATSTADPTKFGSVTLTITQPPVQLWSISPTSVPAGPFTIQLNGSNFGANSVVNLGGTALTTTLLSSTKLQATGDATAVQAGTQIPITVTNTGLGGTTSTAVNLSITAANPVTVNVMPTTTALSVSATQLFSATVTGATNTAVTWSVNNVVGGNAAVGLISSSGLYTAPVVAPNPASVTIRATSVANSASSATAAVSIIAGPPDPGPGQGTPNLSAARFLEQAAFGPTPAELAHVKQIGFDAWLTEQFNAPETPIVNPGGMSSGAVQSQYLYRLSQAPDQLRQRVAYALSQIIVISMNKNIYPDEIVPYLQILSENAFGNYLTLLDEISTSSQMGKYLDLANSNKPNPGSGANENYARELMQLFTIGLTLLNLDGSSQSMPTYDQSTIQQVALALTGWTYPGTGNNNWENFSGPLQPRDVNHDMRQKTFLDCTLPADQTTTQDMSDTVYCLFNHPNVGPFIATRLIRSLVMSNPSPAYIQRVAAVFNNNGAGVRGDLRAVVKTILLDAEARNDVASATSGRLKDPIFHVVALVRALNGTFSPNNGLPWMFGRMGQAPLTPPSVFSFYSPLYRIPQSSLFGPEFQIYTPTESVLRGNFLWAILSNSSSDFTVDLSPFMSVAGNTTQLIDAVDQALLYGRMPPSMRQSLATAITAQADNTNRVRTALYLTALSGLFVVQY
ncbi:MAG: DUF1800 family protein [Gammaproteobacteria bacterium]|nr:DUF1800 family protein [Gammaproteobacteria bacterium]